MKGALKIKLTALASLLVFVITSFGVIAETEVQSSSRTVEEIPCPEIVNGVYMHCVETVYRDGDGNVTDIKTHKWPSVTWGEIKSKYTVFTNSDFLKAEKGQDKRVVRLYRKIWVDFSGNAEVYAYNLIYTKENGFYVSEVEPEVKYQMENIIPLLLLLLCLFVGITTISFEKSTVRPTSVIIIVVILGLSGVVNANIASIFIFVFTLLFPILYYRIIPEPEEKHSPYWVIVTGGVALAMIAYNVILIEVFSEVRMQLILWCIALIIMDHFVWYQFRKMLKKFEEQKRLEAQKIEQERFEQERATKRWWFLKFLDRMSFKAG